MTFEEAYSKATEIRRSTWSEHAYLVCDGELMLVQQGDLRLLLLGEDLMAKDWETCLEKEISSDFQQAILDLIQGVINQFPEYTQSYYNTWVEKIREKYAGSR